MLTLNELIKKLREIFEDDHIDKDEVMKVSVEFQISKIELILIFQVLESYKSNPNDWKKYANWDTFKYCS